MIRWLLLVALTVIAVGSAQPGAIERRVKREVAAAEQRDHEQSTRYVDMSVTLHVLRKDPSGRELIKGCPLSILVRTHHLGGMVDTWGKGNGGIPYRSGPGKSPAIWTCSEQMESLILHGNDLPSWILCTGGMGAGKTTALAQWVYCRVLEHLGHADRQIGVFAPTAPRMTVVVEAIGKLWRRSWMVGNRMVPTDRDGLLTFRAGPSVRFVTAHRQSEAEGTRIAGFNLVAGAADEMQDFFIEWPHILARLRSDPYGRNKLFASCTAKDNTAWRNFRETCERSPDWRITRIPGIDSPFIPEAHWRKMRDGGMTLRLWQQLALAMDVGPEAQVYHCFRRKLDDGTPANLRPVPLGAVDCTAQELAAYGRNIGVLVGHDPGKRQHVSMFLKAYRFPGRDQRPRWFVVREITSPDCTVNSHAQEVLKVAREEFGCNTLDWKGRPSETSPQILVRIDPHTRSGDEHPGRDVYAIWRNLGILTRAAAYKPAATAGSGGEPGVIKRESRIDLVNTLLCATNAEGEIRRLFILCDDKGKIAAPKLLAAFESMERNAASEAEHERKNESDLSHWPAAVGYALWQVEHPRMMAVAS